MALCSLGSRISGSEVLFLFSVTVGFPGGSVVKNPPADAGDIGEAGSIPGSGRSPGRGNGNPLQYSHLGNPKDNGVWWAKSMGSKRVRHNRA